MNFGAIIGSFVRTAIAAGAGALVAKGIIDEKTAESATNAGTTIVLGAVGYGFAQAWSLVQKFNPLKK